MIKRLIYILLISFTLLTCTVNVNAKELKPVSSINTLQIHYSLDDDCEGVLGDPSNDTSTAWLIQEVVGYMRTIGILLVIALSGLDFTRAIIQNDEKSMASVKNHLLTRVLGILLLFMLPTIVQVLLTAFGFYTSCDTQVFNAFIINTLKGVSVLC